MAAPPPTSAGESPKYALEDLSRLKQVGRGPKSVVWLVKHTPTSQYFALKEISREAIKSQEEAQHIWNERSVLAELSEEAVRFPRCCRLFAAMKDERAVYLLLEFIPGAPLHKHFRACGGFSEDRARFYAAELAEILGALHSRGIIYRDLKASNVMLDSKTGRLRLVDFGFAKKLECTPGDADGDVPQRLRRTTSVCGTFFATAPEVVALRDTPAEQRHGYTVAADWWSLGVIVFEMIMAQPPFGYQDGPDLRARTAASPASIEFPDAVAGAAREFVAALLQAEPSRRLGASGGVGEIRAHRWFQGFEWASVAVDAAARPASGAEAAAALGAEVAVVMSSPPEFDGDLGEFASFESVDLNAEAASSDASSAESAQGAEPSVGIS